MVQHAKRALQTSLALQPSGSGSLALQQAAIASTSDCEKSGAAVAASRMRRLSLSAAAAPPRDEEAVSSTTECEAIASTSSDRVQPGTFNKFSLLLILATAFLIADQTHLGCLRN